MAKMEHLHLQLIVANFHRARAEAGKMLIDQNIKCSGLYIIYACMYIFSYPSVNIYGCEYLFIDSHALKP